jgi:hypothetical protein
MDRRHEKRRLRDARPRASRKEITYEFEDEFYIRRLAHGDKNAVDRSRAFYKKSGMNGTRAPFRAVARFETRADSQHRVQVRAVGGGDRRFP